MPTTLDAAVTQFTLLRANAIANKSWVIIFANRSYRVEKAPPSDKYCSADGYRVISLN